MSEENTRDTSDVGAFEATGHATEGTDASPLASLGLNGQLFLFQLFNFFLVLAIVWFLILKPLTKKMDERKKHIDDSLDKAKEIDVSFQMSQRKYQERIDEAKVEANKIIAAAHDAGEQMKNSFTKKTKEEVEMLVTQAKRNIEIDKVAMREELRQETGALVVDTVQKFLTEKLDTKKDKALIDSLLAKMK